MVTHSALKDHPIGDLRTNRLKCVKYLSKLKRLLKDNGRNQREIKAMIEEIDIEDMRQSISSTDSERRGLLANKSSCTKSKAYLCVNETRLIIEINKLMAQIERIDAAIEYRKTQGEI